MQKKSPSQLNKHGKAFEKIVSDAFSPLETKHPIVWERVIDSAAAGNLIRDAEADFRLRVKSENPGQPFEFLIECKASVLENSFNRCFRSLIKPAQLPLMRKAARAGCCCLYLFHSVNNREIEIWSLKQLKEAYYAKRTKFEGQPLYVLEQKDLPNFALRLVTRTKAFINLLGEFA